MQQTITNPFREFHHLHKMREESRCIKGAILPMRLLNATQQIAVVIYAKCRVKSPVLCGLIHEHADKLVDEVN